MSLEMKHARNPGVSFEWDPRPTLVSLYEHNADKRASQCVRPPACISFLFIRSLIHAKKILTVVNDNIKGPSYYNDNIYVLAETIHALFTN